MIESKFVSAEELCIRMVSRWTPDGRTEPQPETDLRGTPIGDRAEVWEIERLVPPSRGDGRRRRQKLRILYCPEGWHSASGSSDRPSGREICCTILSWRARNMPVGEAVDAFKAFHAEHPVVWVVHDLTPGHQVTSRYCDPELPDEYRPSLITETAPAPAARPRRERLSDPEPSYFAHWDWYPRTGQPRLSHWYRVQRGAAEGPDPGLAASGKQFRAVLPQGPAGATPGAAVGRPGGAPTLGRVLRRRPGRPEDRSR